MDHGYKDGYKRSESDRCLLETRFTLLWLLWIQKALLDEMLSRIAKSKNQSSPAPTIYGVSMVTISWLILEFKYMLDAMAILATYSGSILVSQIGLCILAPINSFKLQDDSIAYQSWSGLIEVVRLEALQSFSLPPPERWIQPVR